MADAQGDLLAAIARVRRAMPRNADVMLICDVLSGRWRRQRRSRRILADQWA
jgi:hypothetical protein